MLKKKSFIVVFYAILAVVSLILVDGVFKLTYWPKSIIKIIMFGIIPLLLMYISKDKIKEKFVFKFKDVKLSLILGVSLYLIIVLGYFILRNFIDFSGVLDSLTNNMGVTKDNFLFVSLYICIFNSFLEEFMFRNYLFLNLNINKKLKYLISSLFFAIYHIGILNGWFNIFLILLALVLLVIAGMFFNYLDKRSNSIYPSWLLHFFANVAINTIGFILFGII